MHVLVASSLVFELSFRKKEAANGQFQQYAILIPYPDVDNRSSDDDADTENEDDMEDE